MRIAILGGGVAGVVLARALRRAHLPSAERNHGSMRGEALFDVALYERNQALGGLHRSIDIDGVHYDIGAFLFDPEHELLQTFPVLYSHFLPIDQSNVVITRHRTWDLYPMSVRGYIRDNPLPSILLDLVSLAGGKLRHHRRDSLLSFVRYYLGDRLYRRSGLKTYIERFYGTRDTDVDLRFAQQRLATISEKCSLRHNAARLARDLFDPASESDIWRCYIRPQGGFPEAYRIIQEELEADGVDLRFSTTIERVEKVGERFRIDQASGGSEEYDLIISTIPVGVMLRLIGETPEQPPETMRLVSLFYRYRGDPGFDANILFNFTEEGRWKRLTLFSAAYGRVEGEHYFTVECTQRRHRQYETEEERSAFEEHLHSLPMLKGELKWQGGVVTNDAYPFFRHDDMAHIDDATRLLESYGIALAGRQGQFRYITAHDTARTSRDLARRITREQKLTLD